MCGLVGLRAWRGRGEVTPSCNAIRSPMFSLALTSSHNTCCSVDACVCGRITRMRTHVT